MKAREKYSKKSLVANVLTSVSILLSVNIANSYSAKNNEFCAYTECKEISLNDEIENAMKATAANIHLWSGNRSYKNILKAIILSSSKNQVGKIVEINQHMLAMAMDVGNLRMAKESVSIINRFAPQTLARLDQGSLFNGSTAGLTMFQRLNLNNKFSGEEIDYINFNVQPKGNSSSMGKNTFKSFETEISGEAAIVDGIYNSMNDGTGEVTFFTKNKNNTDTFFSRLQNKMAQLSKTKKDCTLVYMATMKKAAAEGMATVGGIGMGIGATAGSITLPVIGTVGGAEVGAAVGATAGGFLYRSWAEPAAKIELEKCNEEAKDPKIKPETAQQSDNKEESDEDDLKKKFENKNYESPDADLQDGNSPNHLLLDLLTDFYSTINFKPIENYGSSPLTVEQIQIKIDSVANFGNKEDNGNYTPENALQKAIQKQEKWTTPIKNLN